MATEDKKTDDRVDGLVVDADTGKAVEAQKVQNVYVPQPARVFQVEGNDVRGYQGVDPEYMNYAGVEGQPLMNEVEEAAYNERQRKVAVANGLQEPADDDMVFVEGSAYRYGDVKAEQKSESADERKAVKTEAPAEKPVPSPTAPVTQQPLPAPKAAASTTDGK